MNSANKMTLRNDENTVTFAAAGDGWVTMTNSVGERASMLRAEAEGRIAVLLSAGWEVWY